MKNRHHNDKIFRDGIARGREMQRADDQAEIDKLKASLDKALAENLAMRPKPESLDAMITRHESTAAIAR